MQKKVRFRGASVQGPRVLPPGGLELLFSLQLGERVCIGLMLVFPVDMCHAHDPLHDDAADRVAHVGVSVTVMMMMMMFVCVCVCVCVCLHPCICVGVCMYACMSMQRLMHDFNFLYANRDDVCMFVCMYVCMYVCARL